MATIIHVITLSSSSECELPQEDVLMENNKGQRISIINGEFAFPGWSREEALASLRQDFYDNNLNVRLCALNLYSQITGETKIVLGND